MANKNTSYAVQAPYQKAVYHNLPDTTLGSEFLVDKRFLDSDLDIEEILDVFYDYRYLGCKMIHKAFYLLNNGYKNFATVKKYLCDKYNVKSRFANACVKEAKTQYTAKKEIQKTRIKEKKEKIKTEIELISKTELEKQEFHRSIEDWSKTTKENYKKLKEYKNKIWQYKRRLAKLNNELAVLEENDKNKHVRCCFGTAKQLKTRNFLSKEEEIRQWKMDWYNLRNKSFSFLGSKDETCGNALFQITPVDDKYKIKHRIKGKVGCIYEVKMKSIYRDDDTEYNFHLNLHYMNDRLKKQLLDGEAVKYQVCFRKGRVYIKPSITYNKHMKKDDKFPEVSKDLIDELQLDGMVALDFNKDFLSMSVLDKEGHVVLCDDILFDVDKSTCQNEESLQQVLDMVFKLAKKRNCGVAIEGINLSKRKSRMRKNINKKLNRIIHLMPYNKYLKFSVSKSIRVDVPLFIVSAYYTSKIGKEKYLDTIKVNSIHKSASYVIGRRALGFHEFYTPKEKENKK